MSEIKVRLSVLVPGAVMLSSQECEENPKESYVKNTLTVEYKQDGKKQREALEFYTRKSRPAVQSMSISKEAYSYMVSVDGMPQSLVATSKNAKFQWMRMSKKDRLIAHLNLIAESLGGKVESYEIFEN